MAAGGAGQWGVACLALLLYRPLFEGENEFCLYLEELFPNLKVWCTLLWLFALVVVLVVVEVVGMCSC